MLRWTQGLLGDKLIDIDPAPRMPPCCCRGHGPSANSVDYDVLIAEGAAAVGELLEITENLSELTAVCSRERDRSAGS